MLAQIHFQKLNSLCGILSCIHHTHKHIFFSNDIYTDQHSHITCILISHSLHLLEVYGNT